MAIEVVAGLQGAVEGKQGATVAGDIVVLEQGTDNFYEEGTTDSTDLLGGMLELVEENRNEDAH